MYTQSCANILFVTPKGFTTRDRRKPHIQQADAEAEAIANALSEPDSDGAPLTPYTVALQAPPKPT